MSATAHPNPLSVPDLDGVLDWFPDTPPDRVPARLNPAHAGWMRGLTAERPAEWQAPRIAGRAALAAPPFTDS